MDPLGNMGGAGYGTGTAMADQSSYRARQRLSQHQAESVASTGYSLSGGHPSPFQPQTQGQPPEAPIQPVYDQLAAQGFSKGLAKALVENTDAFAQTIWIVDNSGSMQIGDGSKIVVTHEDKMVVQPVTRWEEIQDTVIYHAQMAAVLNAPTVFRLLNNPGPAVGQQEFTIAKDGQEPERDIHIARQIMTRTKPDGVTPLTDHILQIQSEIQQMLPHLQRTGQRVAVILATDGLPTDEQGYGGDDITDEFIRSLRALEGLPVWLVIRLCTDEENVTAFYNELDNLLELSLEVLDDFLGEAREVSKCNRWLNYALPMHRCRELGYHDRLFDLIDERQLTRGELREFCALLFGIDLDVIPDPVSDWKEFVSFVEQRLGDEAHQWNPIKKKRAPWISLKNLSRTYEGSTCAVS